VHQVGLFLVDEAVQNCVDFWIVHTFLDFYGNLLDGCGWKVLQRVIPPFWQSRLMASQLQSWYPLRSYDLQDINYLDQVII
jgi:hypothetical protein